MGQGVSDGFKQVGNDNTGYQKDPGFLSDFPWNISVATASSQGFLNSMFRKTPGQDAESEGSGRVVCPQCGKVLSSDPMTQGQVWGPQAGLPLPNFMHMSPSMNAVFQCVSPSSGGPTVRKRAWPCPQCGKSFSDQGALIYHKEAIHDRKVFQYCGSFPKLHTSNYLPVGEQTYGSHLGSFSEQLSYPQGSGVLPMGSIHRLMSERPVDLPGSSGLLVSPSGGKTKRKRTACPVCERLFSDQRAMLYHKESAHEDKVFPCECGKVYKHKPNLMAHAKRCFHRLTLVQKVE
ncbi:transcriptional repressor Rhit-like [Haliotis asinina]|uniref:transcriptional repressor Rhit-like n=1 Tax=Haliotis asinina TaxID=109174 RepID=UPI003531AD60